MTLRLAAILLACLALPPLAQPTAAQPRRAEPACTAPPGPLQASICADAELRAADRRLRELERAVAAATSRPAALAVGVAAWQRWLDAVDPATLARPEGSPGLLSEYETRSAQLAEQLRQDRAMRRLEQARDAEGRPLGPVLARPATLETRCLGAVLRDCRVTAAGVAVSEDGRRRVLWQQQHGHTEADGLRAGIVLLAEARGGWRLLGWSFEGFRFDPPRIVGQDGELLLHVVGRRGNTGTANTDLLFRLERGAWAEVETESWFDALAARLPAGLEPWNAMDLDPQAMAGRQALAREGDANCCPSGGAALLDFRIANRALVLEEVQLNATARAAAARPAACPAERATYRLDAQPGPTAELRGGWPGAGAASDLLLRLGVPATGQAFWFSFAVAQGYGSQSLIPVEPPGPTTREDGVTALEVEEELRPLLGVHAFDAELAILSDPPRSGRSAPRHLFTPGIGVALHYGWLPGQTARAEMPPALWTLAACRAE